MEQNKDPAAAAVWSEQVQFFIGLQKCFASNTERAFIFTASQIYRKFFCTSQRLTIP